eukprot:1158452-Pelagomonas_calceolata.AAC.5
MPTLFYSTPFTPHHVHHPTSHHAPAPFTHSHYSSRHLAPAPFTHLQYLLATTCIISCAPGACILRSQVIPRKLHGFWQTNCKQWQPSDPQPTLHAACALCSIPILSGLSWSSLEA